MEYEDIRKVIESCHLNFLIGSGASKPFLDTLQGIETALDAISKREGLSKEQDRKEIVKYIEVCVKHHYFKKCIERNRELLNVNNETNSTLNCYKDFLRSLQTILVKRATSIISKQVNVFTTNMDVFLDISLEQLGYSFNDGFSGRMNPCFSTENYHNIIHKVSSHYEYQSTVPLFNLFKLHGSLNWSYNNSTSKIEYDNKFTVTTKLSENVFSDGEMLNCFNYDGRFRGLVELYTEAEARYNVALSERLNNFSDKYDQLVMVNPNKEKFEVTTLKLSYYELLRMYSNNLEKENSVLFVVGFSFADEHICQLTIRVAKANPTLLIAIFAYNDDAETEIKERLEENPNIIYVPRNGTSFSLEEVNRLFFKRLSNELMSPSTVNTNGNGTTVVSNDIDTDGGMSDGD